MDNKTDKNISEAILFNLEKMLKLCEEQNKSIKSGNLTLFHDLNSRIQAITASIKNQREAIKIKSEEFKEKILNISKKIEEINNKSEEDLEAEMDRIKKSLKKNTISKTFTNTYMQSHSRRAKGFVDTQK